jgi:hypothetical protein
VSIYRFPGVLDSGGSPFLGSATVFHCTNFGGATENMRFVTRRGNGSLATNIVLQIMHLQTLMATTHFVSSYGTQNNLETGPIVQGTTAIAATSINIICTAVTIDAAATVPHGVALRGIRFSPVPGSQE